MRFRCMVALPGSADSGTGAMESGPAPSPKAPPASQGYVSADLHLILLSARPIPVRRPTEAQQTIHAVERVAGKSVLSNLPLLSWGGPATDSDEPLITAVYGRYAGGTPRHAKEPNGVLCSRGPALCNGALSDPGVSIGYWHSKQSDRGSRNTRRSLLKNAASGPPAHPPDSPCS